MESNSQISLGSHEDPISLYLLLAFSINNNIKVHTTHTHASFAHQRNCSFTRHHQYRDGWTRETPRKRPHARDSSQETPCERLPARDSSQETPCERLLARDSSQETTYVRLLARDSLRETHKRDSSQETPRERLLARDSLRETPSQRTPCKRLLVLARDSS